MVRVPAAKRSGLVTSSFQLEGPRLKGTAGTRNCDWWFSQDAILLDTAGRFAVEDDDQDEWFAFLETVKKFRPKRPIDGVVVALSVTDIMTSDETQIEDLATKLRTRVDELMMRLEMVVPVYVMFTKADLIAGFVEFCSFSSKTQRGKVWGDLRARRRPPRRTGAGFRRRIHRLLKVLHSRMLTRLSGERVPQVRSRVLRVPARASRHCARRSQSSSKSSAARAPSTKRRSCAGSTLPAARRWEDRSTRCSPTWCEGSTSLTRQASHR